MNSPTSVNAAEGVIVLSDGRRIGYRIDGDPAGSPVLALHGTPGSRRKFERASDAATACGLALVSVDRWGYGISDQPAAVGLAAFAEDMCAVMAVLGWHRFAVLGVSGGGPFAVAVAAVLGRQATALALVAPVGEMVGARVQGVRMRPLHRFCFHWLASQPNAVRAIFALFGGLLAVSPRAAIALATARAASCDKAIMRDPGAAAHLAATFSDGMAVSVVGPAIDLAVFRRQWDIDPADVTCPSRLWLGREDRNVPLESAARLARHIPECSLVTLEGAGHYWIVANAAEVLAWLSDAIASGGMPTAIRAAPR